MSQSDQLKRMNRAGPTATAQIDAHAPSVKERVQYQITDMERALAEKKELLQLLEANPAIERAMTLLGGGNY